MFDRVLNTNFSPLTQTTEPDVSLPYRNQSIDLKPVLQKGFKKGVLKNFSKFSGKNLCKSAFFKKVAGITRAHLLKKDSGTGVFL